MFEGGDEEGDDLDLYRSTSQDNDLDKHLPPLYSIHRGEVVSVKDFGAFVKILEGDRNRDRRDRGVQGLLHISEISKLRVENIREVLSVGEKIWVKVIKTSNGKISFSMRLVSQSDGKDLDTNNVELMMSEQKRKPNQSKTRDKYQLDAILPTVCEKCKSFGHATYECWNTNSNNNYSASYPLLTDDPILPSANVKIEHQSHSHHQSKKNHKEENGEFEIKEILNIDQITSKEQALEVLNRINKLKSEKKKHKHHHHDKKEKREKKKKGKHDKSDKKKHKHHHHDKKDKRRDNDRKDSDRYDDSHLPIRKMY